MPRKVFTLTATSPNAASTAAATGTQGEAWGLEAYDSFSVHGALQGATGGTLDVYVQRLVQAATDAGGAPIWEDWIHFTQLGAAAAAVKYAVSPVSLNTIATVGQGTSPALAAGSSAGGHPGKACRLLFVAGASTSAGAVQTVKISAWTANR